MNINLTDDRTTVGSYDNRSSGGVFLMPKERYMREGAPIQPQPRECATARQTRRSFRALVTWWHTARAWCVWCVGDTHARRCVVLWWPLGHQGT